MVDDTLYLLIRDASTKDIVDASLEHEGIVPIIIIKVMEELFLLLISKIWRKDSHNKGVDEISVPHNGRLS